MSKPTLALDEIIQKIIFGLREMGFEHQAEELVRSADGASTGTEGLLLMIEYLCDLAEESPVVIKQIKGPIDELIHYCTSKGIQLDDTLTRLSNS